MDGLMDQIAPLARPSGDIVAKCCLGMIVQWMIKTAIAGFFLYSCEIRVLLARSDSLMCPRYGKSL